MALTWKIFFPDGSWRKADLDVDVVAADADVPLRILLHPDDTHLLLDGAVRNSGHLPLHRVLQHQEQHHPAAGSILGTIVHQRNYYPWQLPIAFPGTLGL